MLLLPLLLQVPNKCRVLLNDKCKNIYLFQLYSFSKLPNKCSVYRFQYKLSAWFCSFSALVFCCPRIRILFLYWPLPTWFATWRSGEWKLMTNEVMQPANNAVKLNSESIVIWMRLFAYFTAFPLKYGIILLCGFFLAKELHRSAFCVSINTKNTNGWHFIKISDCCVWLEFVLRRKKIVEVWFVWNK